jgi:regulator of sigma D
MTGYGLAFPRNSRFLKMFNQRLLDYRDNGMFCIYKEVFKKFPNNYSVRVTRETQAKFIRIIIYLKIQFKSTFFFTYKKIEKWRGRQAFY